MAESCSAMSYILDTLKKLEKEKLEFNNKLDLEKLILKDGSEADIIKILKRRSHFLTFLILAISMFFFLNFFVFNYRYPASKPPPVSDSQKEKKNSKQAQMYTVRNPVRTLPPPSEISNEVKASRDLKLVQENKDNVSSAIDAPDVQDKKNELVSKRIDIKNEINKGTETIPLPHDLSDEDLSQRLDHIEQLIQKEYIPEELNKLTDREKKKEKPTQGGLSKAVSHEAIPHGIQDLKIKGIVFFGEDNPLNYALASFKGESQIKVKEGSRLDDIEVLEIQSDKILLIFKNKIFEKKLGR